VKTWAGTLHLLTTRYPRKANVRVEASTPAAAARRAVDQGLKEIRVYAGGTLRATGLVLRLTAAKKESPDDPGTV